MKAKLSKELCYIAGLSRLSYSERSLVYAKSETREIIEKFIKEAIKLGVDPRKIIVNEKESEAKFYHSKLARNIREIIENETKIFKHRNELSASFVAGIFDARGVIEKSIEVKGLKPSEAVLLEDLGIHVKDNKIANVRDFIMFIKGFSVRIELTQLPGNERDPR